MVVGWDELVVVRQDEGVNGSWMHRNAQLYSPLDLYPAPPLRFQLNSFKSFSAPTPYSSSVKRI